MNKIEKFFDIENMTDDELKLLSTKYDLKDIKVYGRNDNITFKYYRFAKSKNRMGSWTGGGHTYDPYKSFHNYKGFRFYQTITPHFQEMYLVGYEYGKFRFYDFNTTTKFDTLEDIKNAIDKLYKIVDNFYNKIVLSYDETQMCYDILKKEVDTNNVEDYMNKLDNLPINKDLIFIYYAYVYKLIYNLQNRLLRTILLSKICKNYREFMQKYKK